MLSQGKPIHYDFDLIGVDCASDIPYFSEEDLGESREIVKKVINNSFKKNHKFIHSVEPLIIFRQPVLFSFLRFFSVSLPFCYFGVGGLTWRIM